MNIQPFEEKHIEEAATLFQSCYVDLKSKFTYLPVSFENVDLIAKHLKEISKDNPGFVAIRSNRLVGYIVGYSSIKNFKGSQNGAYVPEWGNAAIEEEKELIYEELYKRMSQAWVDRKSYTHAISFIANKRTIDVFSLLGFGLLVVDAVKDINPLNVKMTSEYRIETTTEKHIDELRELTNHLYEHINSPPIFVKNEKTIFSDLEIRKRYLSDNKITLIAIQNDKIVSCIKGQMNQGNISIIDQEGTFGIDFGFTRNEYRKKNIAANLLNEIVTTAKNNGAKLISVDFETQNTEARRFWSKYFSPIVYSMMRKIDDRI